MAIEKIEDKKTEIETLEQSKDAIVSARGTYAALILMSETDNSSVNEKDVNANDARHPGKEEEQENGFFIYFWCPSTDGTYQVTEREYNFVNVPKHAEDGTEITYRAGDIIDISFDDGDITSPRFVRLWGLIHDINGLGHDAIKSNLAGIRSGNFPSSLEGALNLFSLQKGAPAVNLYPYLCRILTGVDEPKMDKYKDLSTESFFNPDYYTETARHETAVSSRFLFSFYFTSYWSSAIDAVEEEEFDSNTFDPWAYYDQASTIEGESSTGNRDWCNHLNPHWIMLNNDFDTSLVSNLVKFIHGVSRNGVSSTAKRKAAEIEEILVEPFKSSENIIHFTNTMHDELEGKPWSPDGYADYPISEFAQGTNVRFRGPGHGWGNILGTHYEIRTKNILDSWRNEKNNELLKEAVASYLTAILNVTIDYFKATKGHQFFDALAFTALYPYLRYFYVFSIDVPSVSTKTTTYEDFLSGDGRGSSTVNIDIFKAILEWAKTKVTGNEKLNSIQKVEGSWSLDKSKKMADDMTNIMSAVRDMYVKLGTQEKPLDKKVAVLREYLNLFQGCSQIPKALETIDKIYNLINDDPDFADKINDVGDLNSGNDGGGPVILPSGQLIWPVPAARYGDVFSGFNGSKWLETNPRAGHGGIDISVAEGGINGKPVVSAMAGTLTVKYTSCTHDYGKVKSCGCGGGYGNWISINHGNGFETRYAHLSKVNTSLNGRLVEANTEIGNVGSTGHSDGPHLHFETRVNGTPVDPYAYFVGAATTPGGKEFSLPNPYPDKIFNAYMSYLALGSNKPIYRFINDNAIVDANGIMTIGGAYCVAMGTFYNVADSAGRRWGRIYEITMESGSVFKVITTDTKSDADTNSTHQYCTGNGSILEYVVNIKDGGKTPTKSPVYSGDSINTKAPWKGKIKKIVFVGIHPKTTEYNW